MKLYEETKTSVKETAWTNTSYHRDAILGLCIELLARNFKNRWNFLCDRNVFVMLVRQVIVGYHMPSGWSPYDYIRETLGKANLQRRRLETDLIS